MDKLVIFLVGILVGFIIYSVVLRVSTIGTLRIDQSDPAEPPYLFLELDKTIDTVITKSHAVFKVKRENFISHI